MKNDLFARPEPVDWQHPVHSLPDELWDVLIVGAGPAGAMTAIHLATEGYRVLLLDKERFPREKVCGDGLIADSTRCLRRVGLLDQVREMAHASPYMSGFSPSGLEAQVPATFLLLRRHLLDTLVARRAVDSGAVLCRGEVRRISIEPGGSVTCVMAGDSRAYRARVCVIATGTRLELVKKLGMVDDPRPGAVALRCYLRSSFELDRCVIASHRATLPGYGWIFPMGHQQYNVGVITYRSKKKSRLSLRDVYRRFMEEFPLAGELMRHGEPLSPLKGGVLRTGLRGTRPLGDGNILAVGETIGTTLPYTGEGIGKAMESGEMAAQVIHAALRSGNFGILREYPLRLEKEMRSLYSGYATAQNWLSRPWLNNFMTRRVTKSNYVRATVTDIMNGTVNPKTILSLRGVFKSFFA